MFHLIKILNGRISVPEPERIALTANTTVEYGTLITVKDGVATLFNAASTSLPTHLVLADSTGKNVLAARVSPDMVFEAPVSATPTAMIVGGEYLLSSDGKSVSATLVSSGKRGAHLVNKAGASKADDKIYVAFR